MLGSETRTTDEIRSCLSTPQKPKTYFGSLYRQTSFIVRVSIILNLKFKNTKNQNLPLNRVERTSWPCLSRSVVQTEILKFSHWGCRTEHESWPTQTLKVNLSDSITGRLSYCKARTRFMQDKHRFCRDRCWCTAFQKSTYEVKPTVFRPNIQK